MKERAAYLPAALEDNDFSGENRLLWVLIVAAIGFAIWHPRGPMDTLRLVDWQTVGAIACYLTDEQRGRAGCRGD